jgi:aspartate aminotransferase
MTRRRIASRVANINLSGIRKLFDAAGPDSISLGLGQPDFDTPLHIKEAAIRAIREGRTAYTANTGIPELRAAVSAKFRNENGLDYLPDQLIVTAGASEALHLVMEALVSPGEKVLFPDPGFVAYPALAEVAGGRPVGIPLDRNLRIDIEKAKEAMNGARILVLNSPGNPTGAVETKDSIRALVEYANDRGVTVVSDEVYEHFIYGARHWSAGLFGEDVITINATSKTYAMTGWRLGYLAAPKEYIEPCLKVHQYCQACATSISQYAALAAYTGDQRPVKQMRDEYHARRDLLYSGLRDLGLNFPLPEGAFYFFVPMAKELVRMVMARGVIIVPGDAFGTNAPEYARMSYATARENLIRALDRIRSAMDEYGKGE